MTPQFRFALVLLCSGVLACGRGSASADDPSQTTGGGGTGNAGGATGGGVAGGSGGGGGSAMGGAGGANPGGGQAAGGDAAGGAASNRMLPNDTASGVFVHLFEWRWADIATECEQFLGPKGFTAAQVSPPNEHAVLANYSYPWWQRYQPVSYALESRSGTRAEFVDMVQRCRAAGVGIYVDAVLNHMTAQASGVGSGGTKFTKYEYPGLYTQADFHQPICAIQGSDYASNAAHVQSCELVSLADLDTGSATVQAKEAAYLSDLLAIGVRGFRLDAAKHMAPADISGILKLVKPRDGEKPYYFLEVIDYGGEAIHATDYLDVAGDAAELDVTEFKYKGVGDAILGNTAGGLAGLKSLDAASWSLLPSDRAVSFITNHDTERADAIYYLDGAANDLGNVFMLAWPYGYPSVMSSFGFNRLTGPGRDHSPPSMGGDATTPVYAVGSNQPSCVAPPYAADTTGWICEHRSRSVANMVAFRKATAGAPVQNVWDNGKNRLAFSRGDRGFVALNHEATPLAQTLATGLAAGKYCDVLSGDFTPAQGGTPASCSGNAVDVDASGKAVLSIPTDTAVAIHADAKL